MADDKAAEMADLEAANKLASNDESDSEEVVEDTSSEDYSEMFADEFGEEFGESEPQRESVGLSDGDGDFDSPIEQEPDEKEAQVEATSEAEESVPQKPSEEEVTREELLSQLRLANAELAQYRAELADKSKADEPSQASGQESVTDLAEVRKAATEYLSKEVYALSQEDADLFLTSPEQVVPQLAAKLHTEILESVGNMVRQAVPNIIQSTMRQNQSRQGWEEKFYGQWPALAEHKDEVQRVKSTMKGLYPDLPEERLDQEVAGFLSIRHGIVPEAPKAGDKVTPIRRPTGHKPLGRGATQPKPKATERNFFEQLAEDDMSDI